MCKYCEHGDRLEIKEAYDRVEFIKVDMLIDGDFISIYQNDGADCDGFYLDINYCPMCGRRLTMEKRYNAYVLACNEHGCPVMSFEDWARLYTEEMEMIE